MTQGTMERIQTVTLTSSQTSIDFQNIPSTYNDLVIKLSVRGDRAANTTEVLGIRLNNSVTSLDTRYIQGDGSSVVSATSTTGRIAVVQGSSSTANTFSSVDIYIPNYAGSTNKSFSVDAVQENNNTEGYPVLTAGLWSNTAAINRVTLVPLFGTNWVANSTATLYGITRVPAGAKATGGVIYDDSSYWYHVFTSSGTFTPTQSLSCDLLVVAGGGGGGKNFGGGGGAGGLVYATAQSVTATNYTVTIGAGGAGQTATWTPLAQNGSNSSFSSTSATGGGYGGGYNGSAYVGGGTGGSGGGGSYNSNGAAGTSGQGNAGGNGGTVTGGETGGGGGAGAVGSNGASGIAGAGGAGTNTYATWHTVTGTGISGYIAGGGGGGAGNGAKGTGGTGGGGDGATNGGVGVAVAGTAGTANTGGGGGGGSWYSGNGASGGSGIVIVRYAK